MPISQNVVSEGEILHDVEPKGLEIAQKLSKNLLDEKWQVSSAENWRDCGCEIEYSCDNVSLNIRISSVDVNIWLLQIVPSQTPCLISRILGRKASAQDSDIYELSQKVHSVLSNSRFRLLRWS